MLEENISFRECRICKCYYKNTCISIAKAYESIPKTYAEEVFKFLQPITEISKSFILKMNDWDCGEGGMLHTYNLKVECEGQEHIYQLRFGGKNPPFFCIHYNECAFVSKLIALLAEQGFEQTKVAGDADIDTFTLWSGVSFSKRD